MVSPPGRKMDAGPRGRRRPKPVEGSPWPLPLVLLVVQAHVGRPVDGDAGQVRGAVLLKARGVVSGGQQRRYPFRPQTNQVAWASEHCNNAQDQKRLQSASVSNRPRLGVRPQLQKVLRGGRVTSFSTIRGGKKTRWHRTAHSRPIFSFPHKQPL